MRLLAIALVAGAWAVAFALPEPRPPAMKPPEILVTSSGCRYLVVYDDGLYSVQLLDCREQKP